MREGNPNHPVTRELREEWHKVAALILFVLGKEKIEITVEDIERFNEADKANIVAAPTGSVLRIYLVGDSEAARLVKKAGGAPV